MNREHFRAFLWLRWRLLVNQMTRGGKANRIVVLILAILAVPSVCSFGLTAFVAGWLAVPPGTRSDWLLFGADVFLVYFFMFWFIGLFVELRRTEALSPAKFLHLPVSLSSVFVLNYLSSWFCLTLAVFIPIAVGFALGLVLSQGPIMLLVLLQILAFLVMTTAVTYQFQGWLASLMTNKRRQRTIIVVVTMIFVLVFQLPNLLNVFGPWHHPEKMTREENQQYWQEIGDMVTLANWLLPPGWLPLGVKAAAEQDVLLAVLASAGMGLLGVASLWRAYRTTLRLHTGAFSAGKKEAPTKKAPPRPETGPPPARWPILLEKKLPGLSEQAAVIALTSFRSLLRAPEAKMMLLSPLILLMVFAGMFSQMSHSMPEFARPFLGCGAILTVLFTLDQLLGNQFGFDRNGFRVFVLCPAPRKDILLGKNLAVAPLAIALCLLPIILVQIVFPVNAAYFLALAPQFFTMYLLYCLQANWLSILIPLQIPSGSLKPANYKATTILLRTLMVLAMPLLMAPTLIPWAIDLVLATYDVLPGGPVCLLLNVLQCAGMIWLYRLVLSWQGAVLQAREQKILDIVTRKAE